jgi:signal transduction histidine kinase
MRSSRSIPVIRGSQQHLLQIISDLLNSSRIEAGRLDYERVPVAVDQVLATVFPMLEPQAATRGLVLEGDPRAEGLVVRADRTRVQQIVLNLPSNAVKFTPRGERATVACAASDDRVTITVSDTGPGIPLEMQETVFEPFVQLGRSLTSGHEGTGLGLAISRDLARAMGGDLCVESAPGEGARFTLVLPAH